MYDRSALDYCDIILKVINLNEKQTAFIMSRLFRFLYQ